MAAPVASGRVVFSPTGPLNRDYSDVRSYGDAAVKGIKKYWLYLYFSIYFHQLVTFAPTMISRAISAGVKRPLLTLAPASNNPIYQHANLVSVLGAFHALYVVSRTKRKIPSLP